MPKGIIVLLILVALTAAAVVLLKPWSGQAPKNQQTSAAPVITGIDFPQQIEADGNKVLGTVHFRDPDGDVIQAKFDVIKAQLFDPFAFDPKVKSQSQGSFQFSIFTMFPQQVTLQVTLIDAQGLESEPVEFSFEAVLLQFHGQP